MNANDKIYFEGIVLNEGAYFYSYYNNIDEAAKKKNSNYSGRLGMSTELCHA